MLAQTHEVGPIGRHVDHENADNQQAEHAQENMAPNSRR